MRKEKDFLAQLGQILRKILARTQISQVRNRNNTEFAILFEAIQVIVKYRAVIELDLQHQVLAHIFLFLEVPEPNIKYLTFEAMTSVLVLPGSDDLMRDHTARVIEALSDLDLSMRRRALDLLYLMCNANNVGALTEELLNYSENCDPGLKEELILKIAILAEKFAPDLNWYLDVIIRLLSRSGDFITDDIWWRVSQIVTGFGAESGGGKSLQTYAVGAILNALSAPTVHENLVKLGSFIIPEFGLRGNLPATRAFQVLDKHFNVVSMETKAMLFDGYAKIAAMIAGKEGAATADETQLHSQILSVFQMYADHLDVELQKRAFEYLTLLSVGSPAVLAAVFKPMPTFNESVQENNPLLHKMIQMLGKNAAGTTDHASANEGIKLIKAQQEIIGAAREKETLSKKLGQNRYQDLFIEAEHIHIKFESYSPYEHSKQRLALKGQNVLLTPENLVGPKSKFEEFKKLLINPSGNLWRDAQIQVDFESATKEAQLQAILTFSSFAGPLKI